MAHGHTRMFLKQLLTNPGATGAIVPSSDELSRSMVECAAPGARAVIAEFGPGTGVITRFILEGLLPEQTFFAIELNEAFADTLRQRFPKLHLYIGNAADVQTYCRQEGADHVDCVISGLPWAIFPEELQIKILQGMTDIMPEGGTFVTFAYLQGLVMPSGRRFKHNVKKFFSHVESSGVIWKNIPPAIIYKCRK